MDGFEECTKVEGQHMVVENCRIINDPRVAVYYPGRLMAFKDGRELDEYLAKPPSNPAP